MRNTGSRIRALGHTESHVAAQGWNKALVERNDLAVLQDRRAGCSGCRVAAVRKKSAICREFRFIQRAVFCFYKAANRRIVTRRGRELCFPCLAYFQYGFRLALDVKPGEVLCLLSEPQGFDARLKSRSRGELAARDVLVSSRETVRGGQDKGWADQDTRT